MCPWLQILQCHLRAAHNLLPAALAIWRKDQRTEKSFAAKLGTSHVRLPNCSAQSTSDGGRRHCSSSSFDCSKLRCRPGASSSSRLPQGLAPTQADWLHWPLRGTGIRNLTRFLCLSLDTQAVCPRWAAFKSTGDGVLLASDSGMLKSGLDFQPGVLKSLPGELGACLIWASFECIGDGVLLSNGWTSESWVESWACLGRSLSEVEPGLRLVKHILIKRAPLS